MARAYGETRARAFAEFARLGRDLNQSALAETLGVSRARINTLFKAWKKAEAKRLYGVDSIDSSKARVVDGGNGAHILSNAQTPERVLNQEDVQALDASTVDSIIDEAVHAGLDLAHMPPLKARQLLAAAESCRRGSPPVHALMEAGVGRTTAYEWLKDPAIRAFFDAQDGRFVGVATSRAYEIITTGPASVAMQGIQFVLERRFPEFRKNDRVDIGLGDDIIKGKKLADSILADPAKIAGMSFLEAAWQQGTIPEGFVPKDFEFVFSGGARQLPAASEQDLSHGVESVRELEPGDRGGERIEGNPNESRGGYAGVDRSKNLSTRSRR